MLRNRFEVIKWSVNLGESNRLHEKYTDQKIEYFDNVLDASSLKACKRWHTIYIDDYSILDVLTIPQTFTVNCRSLSGQWSLINDYKEDLPK